MHATQRSRLGLPSLALAALLPLTQAAAADREGLEPIILSNSAMDSISAAGSVLIDATSTALATGPGAVTVTDTFTITSQITAISAYGVGVAAATACCGDSAQTAATVGGTATGALNATLLNSTTTATGTSSQSTANGYVYVLDLSVTQPASAPVAAP